MADLSQQRSQFTQAFYDLLLSLLNNSGGGGEYSISEQRMYLIGTVKVKIDEMQPEGEGINFAPEDPVNVTNTLDLYINAILDECAKQIHQTAPLSVIKPKSGAKSISSYGDGTGYIELPDDYLRLSSCRLTGWKREVTEVITPSHPKFKFQSYKQTRGGVAKPVLVASYQTLTYYSLPEDVDPPTVDWFLYVPIVPAEEIQDNLKDALTWLCASKILQIFGQVSGYTELAKMAMAQVELCYKNMI